MPNLKIVNMAGEEKGEIALSDTHFVSCWIPQNTEKEA